MPPDSRTFIDWPVYAGQSYSFDVDLCAALFFGVSDSAVALPARHTGKGKHFRDCKPLSEEEAAQLLVERLRRKVVVAARQGRQRSQSLLAALSRWRDMGGGLLRNQAVQKALDDALETITAAASAPLQENQPTDTVKVLKAELAELAARLELLERGAPA